jgi:hypothetical protein
VPLNKLQGEVGLVEREIGRCLNGLVAVSLEIDALHIIVMEVVAGPTVKAEALVGWDESRHLISVKMPLADVAAVVTRVSKYVREAWQAGIGALPVNPNPCG